MMQSMQSLSIAPPELWWGFIIVVVGLIIFDVAVIHRRSHTVGIKEAIAMSVFWVALALGFNLWFGFQFGLDPGIEFLTGYLVEESLSIDNLFVMILIFGSFRIDSAYQHRILFWGILGAIIMRGVFIIIGAQLIHRFSWIIFIFGGVLIFSAIKFLLETDSEEEVTEHWSIRYARKVLPVTEKRDGQKFFIREDGKLKATPLFLALIAIEVTDLIFAVDSIPAVFSVTKDAFIAFGSNILAVLGLRALYFVLADFIGRFRYLKPGLAAVLGFVGCKMVLSYWFHIPSWISLLVIVSILTTAGLSSWYAGWRIKNGKNKTA